MKTFQNSHGTVFQINVKLLLATGFAFVAYWIWPDSMRGYGWGFLSICLGGAAFGLLVETIRMAVKLYARARTLDEFERLGKKPKSSRLVTDDALKNAGLIDD